MTFSHLKNKDEVILGSIGMKDGKIIVGAEDQEYVYITAFPVKDDPAKFLKGYTQAVRYCNDNRIKLSEPELALSNAMLKLLVKEWEKKRWWKR